MLTGSGAPTEKIDASRMSVSTEEIVDKKANAIIATRETVKVPKQVTRKDSSGTEELSPAQQIQMQRKVVENGDLKIASGQTVKTDMTAQSIRKLKDQVEEHAVRVPTFEGKHELVPGTSPAGKQRKEKRAEKELAKEDFQDILLQTERIDLLNMPPERLSSAESAAPKIQTAEAKDKIIVKGEERKHAD